MGTYHVDVAQFRRDGVCWPAGRVEVAGLVEHYFAVQTEALKRRGRELHISPHLVSTEIDSLVHHPTILDAVALLLGPNFVLWESDFARKEAGGSGVIPWHADAPYWNLSTNEVVSVWLALTEATVANSAMRVVPRTHHQPESATLDYAGDPMVGYRTGVRTSSDDNVFNYDTIIAGDIDPERDAVSVELEPGQFSIHHVELVHGGGPNESDTDRIGVVFRYMSARTFCRTGVDSVTKVRGTVDNDQLVFEPRPTTSFSNEAWRAHEVAMEYPSGFGDRTITAEERA